MPSLWTPNNVADAIIAEGEAKRFLEFRDRLKAIDSRLCGLLADRDDPENDICAGYYYIYRRNEDGTTTFWEVTDDKGKPCEPQEAHLEALRRGDGNRADLPRERAANRRRAEAAKERAKERKREEMRGRLQEEIDYAFRVQHRIRRKPWEETA